MRLAEKLDWKGLINKLLEYMCDLLINLATQCS